MQAPLMCIHSGVYFFISFRQYVMAKPCWIPVSCNDKDMIHVGRFVWSLSYNWSIGKVICSFEIFIMFCQIITVMSYDGHGVSHDCLFLLNSLLPALLVIFRGIHRWPVDSLHKGTVTRKACPYHDIFTSHFIFKKKLNALIETCFYISTWSTAKRVKNFKWKQNQMLHTWRLCVYQFSSPLRLLVLWVQGLIGFGISNIYYHKPCEQSQLTDQCDQQGPSESYRTRAVSLQAWCTINRGDHHRVPPWNWRSSIVWSSRRKIFIPLPNKVDVGYTGFTLSVRPSVDYMVSGA